MSDVVDLRGRSIPIEDDELVEDLARFADGTLTEGQVKARHHLTNKDWLAMGENDELIEKISAAKIRRIRTGATKREKAQLEIVDAPPILGKIMRSPDTNAKHVIDSVKALDALASNGAEIAAAGARFEITINLGSDTERYSKSIEINADDEDPYTKTDTTAFAAKKLTENDGGQGHI